MIQNENQLDNYAAQDGYFGVTNLGGFVAAIYASYTLNGEHFSFVSDTFSLFFYKEISIPVGSTNIHLYALIQDGAGQWVPVYNNNLSSYGMVELKLYGTVFNPYVSIIRDPNPTVLRVLATNNAGFVTRYKLTYTFNNLVYTMESQNFTAGVSREISIPRSASDVSVIADFFTGSNWNNLYNDSIPNGANLDLTFTGITTDPKCDSNISIPPSGGTGVIKKEATLAVAKKPHKNLASLNDIITFAINISNSSSTVATNIVLQETLPNELEFIPKSFKINGITIENDDPSSSTISLDNIQIYSSILVTYQAKIVSLPSSNKIINPSVITFSYLDENNLLQTSTSTSSTIPLSTGTTDSGTCCCCCCPCNCMSSS